MGENRGRVIKEHVSRARGQSQGGSDQEWEAGMVGAWGSRRRKMDTTII